MVQRNKTFLKATWMGMGNCRKKQKKKKYALYFAKHSVCEGWKEAFLVTFARNVIFFSRYKDSSRILEFLEHYECIQWRKVRGKRTDQQAWSALMGRLVASEVVSRNPPTSIIHPPPLWLSFCWDAIAAHHSLWGTSHPISLTKFSCSVTRVGKWLRVGNWIFPLKENFKPAYLLSCIDDTTNDDLPVKSVNCVRVSRRTCWQA